MKRILLVVSMSLEEPQRLYNIDRLPPTMGAEAVPCRLRGKELKEMWFWVENRQLCNEAMEGTLSVQLLVMSIGMVAWSVAMSVWVDRWLCSTVTSL